MKVKSITATALGISPLPDSSAKRVDITSITAAITTNDRSAMRAWQAYLSDLIGKLEAQLARDSAETAAERIEFLANGKSPEEAERLAQDGADHDWRGRVVGLLSIAKSQLHRLNTELARERPPTVQYKPEPRIRLPIQDSERQAREQKQLAEMAAATARKSERARIDQAHSAALAAAAAERKAERQRAHLAQMTANQPKVRLLEKGTAVEVEQRLALMIASGVWIISMVQIDGQVLLVYRDPPTTPSPNDQSMPKES